jgi:hypothetical protein
MSSSGLPARNTSSPLTVLSSLVGLTGTIVSATLKTCGQRAVVTSLRRRWGTACCSQRNRDGRPALRAAALPPPSLPPPPQGDTSLAPTSSYAFCHSCVISLHTRGSAPAFSPLVMPARRFLFFLIFTTFLPVLSFSSSLHFLEFLFLPAILRI